MASSNVWDGNWSGKNHTYVDQFSNAINSILHVSTAAGHTPTNNLGFISTPQAWYGVSSIQIAVGGDYNCYGIPNYKIISLPNVEDDLMTAEQLYMEKLNLYYFLNLNDSVKGDEGSEMFIFFEGLLGGSIDKFFQVEEFLHQGDHTAALDILGTVETDNFNTVEFNYYSFYQIYAAYLKDGELSNYNKNQLHYLGTLCPGINGACVYKAAALYNTIYSEILYQECAQEYGEKMTNSNYQEKNIQNEDPLNIKIYPNPAKDQLHLQTKQKDELLNIIINDLSGRTVFSKTVQVKGFIVTLDIELINGAYLINIANSKNEKTIKKLLIAR